MAGYQPLKITGMTTGLVKNRENFLLPDDAYPTLQNAYVWREKIKRKKGYQLLGRLQRNITGSPGTTSNLGHFLGNLITFFTLQENATIVPGSFTATVGGITYTENTPPDGGLLANGVPAAPGTFINYNTGVLGLVTGLSTTAIDVSFDYNPNLPVMGLRTQELQNSANDQMIAFDQVYAYVYDEGLASFREFIPGTTWNARNGDTTSTDFFWSTNYWVSSTTIPGTATPFFTTSNFKLFWVTNNTGAFGPNADPIRITDGVTWYPFYDNTTPANTPWAHINTTDYLVQCLALLPFRGRMLAFNTYEGTNASSAVNFSNRIRWSTIGNPFIPFDVGPPARGSWRDDIRGQGGFLDIPTSEDIVSVGFVRDNLVIYCERSTWQLRYTGRSIAPFQIEKVNSELGGEGPFSAIQFDTSLVGIGDKGVVECDSYKSERIDIKIPDFIFQIQSLNNGPYRVHGIRNFMSRLAYWTIPLASETDVFPTQRLVYNYENDSWALFNDSLTCLGNYQPQSSRTWLNTPIPWIECDFTWINQPQSVPKIVGGNQQGFVEYLDELTVNDVSLFIDGIIANSDTANNIQIPTVIISQNHNMQTGFVIKISDIIPSSPYVGLNDGVFGVEVIDADSFQINTFDPITGEFSEAQANNYVSTITAITNANPAKVTTSSPTTLTSGQQVTIYNVMGMTQINGLTSQITVIDPQNFTLDTIDSTGFSPYVANTGTAQIAYAGGGLIAIRENFSVVSKKFNFLDEGQSIQLGYIDILMEASEQDNPGAISFYVYLDYDDISRSNALPDNDINDGSPIGNPDTFFNSIIPTTQSALNGVKGTKFWQRVICPSRANFITLQYTFSNAQMAGIEQELGIEIDAQVLWIRRGGRLSQC